MKEPRDLPGLGINSSEVRALVEIALRAGEREIVGIVSAAVLPGDDVFDVKTEAGKLGSIRSGLRRAAGQAGWSLRPSSGFIVSEQGLRFSFEKAQQSVGADNGFQFFLFCRGQLAFGSFFGEFVVARLSLRVGAQVDEGVRKFGSQSARKWAKKSFQSRSFCIDLHVRTLSRSVLAFQAFYPGGAGAFCTKP